jgi:hypothetical protein
MALEAEIARRQGVLDRLLAEGVVDSAKVKAAITAYYEHR